MPETSNSCPLMDQESPTQLAALVVSPRNIAVHAVANRRHGKRHNGQQPVQLVAPSRSKALPLQKMESAKSQDRDLIGGGHALHQCCGAARIVNIPFFSPFSRRFFGSGYAGLSTVPYHH